MEAGTIVMGIIMSNKLAPEQDSITELIVQVRDMTPIHENEMDVLNAIKTPAVFITL